MYNMHVHCIRAGEGCLGVGGWGLKESKRDVLCT